MTTTNTQNKGKLTKAHIFIFLGMLIFFAGYGYYELVLKAKINGSTLIDNPTSKEIIVQIDDQNYIIPAKTFLPVDLAEGHHKISCTEYKISNQDLNLEPILYGVINPTKSKYVIYNIIYTKKDLRSQFKPYQIEGKEVYSLLGEPELTTDLFIPDRTNGKGNIDTAEPDYEFYNKMNQDYSYINKIFRLNDFFAFYDKNNQ